MSSLFLVGRLEKNLQYKIPDIKLVMVTIQDTIKGKVCHARDFRRHFPANRIYPSPSYTGLKSVVFGFYLVKYIRIRTKFPVLCTACSQKASDHS